jgi:plasmid stabilization system protein ParE
LKRLRVQPLARVDAEEAAAWYDAERPGLGVEFILELDLAMEKAAENPSSFAHVAGPVRRVLMRRFPYALYFLFDGDEIEIIAILHQARSAQAWKKREPPPGE